MTELRIEQYEVDKYRVVGSISITHTNRKTVVVDGEEYHKQYMETKDVCATTIDLHEIKLDDLECFGFTPSILEHNFMYGGLFEKQARRESSRQLSTNEYVAYWQWLKYTNRLPFYVKNVYVNDSHDSNVSMQNLTPYCTIKLFDYGFNNSLYADISWRMILTRKDKKSIPYHELIAELLKKHRIYLYKLTDKNITLNTIKLLNKIISQ